MLKTCAQSTHVNKQHNGTLGGVSAHLVGEDSIPVEVLGERSAIALHYCLAIFHTGGCCCAMQYCECEEERDSHRRHAVGMDPSASDS